MTNLRDKKQEEFADLFIDDIKGQVINSVFASTAIGTGAILNLCPRFGKCRVAIKIFNKLKPKKILIAYPTLAVEHSWKDEFKKTGFKSKHVKFTTHRSLSKHTTGTYDMIVVDECHLLSDSQAQALWRLRDSKTTILGLSGTLSSESTISLATKVALFVCTSYSMEEAINDKIITDYHITVKRVPLDTKEKIKYKTSIRTEKEQFDAYSAIIEKLSKTGADPFYLRLARMRLIQASRAKIKATQDLLDKFKDERVLVFCGLIRAAEALKCPVFHSKSKDKKILEDFSSGKGNHLGVVKIGDTGITYKPLNKVVINYFDSNPENLCQKINRCMGIEYANPEKRADIWIVSSDELTEQRWLNRALQFFDPKKITYI